MPALMLGFGIRARAKARLHSWAFRFLAFLGAFGQEGQRFFQDLLRQFFGQVVRAGQRFPGHPLCAQALEGEAVKIGLDRAMCAP